MTAFVPSGGVPATLLPSGLHAVCNPRAPLAAAAAASRASTPSRTTPCMTGSTSAGITLQRMLYEPNPGAVSVEDKDVMCALVWRQVFGNAYVMESERAEAYIAESNYRAGQITLREFVRGVALSSTYRRRFFDCCTPTRAVELNFKHLLGRAPTSKAEVSRHVVLIAEKGFVAEINSYIDSEEYDLAFSEDFVPGRRFKGTYPTIEEFNSMCAIYSSPGTTDKSLSVRARFLGIDNPNRVLSLDGAGVASKYMGKLALNGVSSYVGISRGIPKRANVDFGEFVSPQKVVNERADPVSRVEVVPGSYMYMTASEAQDYARNEARTSKIASFAQKELLDARTQQAALQARIVALEACI